ncbi:MAG: SPOR domain-containing protein [Clostridia bacterium]|nr:SPOR domain-containing protein [Clostridia bacterium]
MKIIEKILTKNPCYIAGRKITVKGLMLHSVGCPQPSAMVFVNNWNPPANGREVCVHGFIDANTGEVYQTLPWDHRGWHGGGSSNNTHIGVEMCEPACIKYTGGSTFTCSDTATAKAAVKRTYEAAVELFAFLCKQYKLDPLADGVIISHKEGHKRGIASNHGDPEHLWTQLKTGYTMDGFRKDVKAAMAEEEKPTAPATPKVLYRVQVGAYRVKSNADAQLKKVKAAGFDTYMVQAGGLYKIQVGAYSVKANAEAMLKKVKAKGFSAYITTATGTAVAATTAAKKSIDEIAKEVIKGKWGNGAERKQKLTAAGYNYSAVQKRVNELCK